LNDTDTIESATSATVKILLVEDNDCDALLLQKMLSGGKYGSFHFRRANCLSAALRELANDGGIDLILLDLGLPDSQGLATFAHIRAAAVRAPIIVLSGLDDEELAITTVQQGAQDYIVKGPVDEGAVLARAIRYAIERCRAQQVLAEEHDLLRSVIDNIPDQVYLKDKDSRFVAVNPVTARFFGASSPGQIVGKSDFDLFPHELAAQFLAEEQALLRCNQPCVNREAAIKDFAGNTQWVLTTKVPLHDHDGNITGLLGINRNITERKEAEEAVLRLNTELEQRVTARTNELSKAVARLEENDRARSEFVSSVSHELKTPLTSMNFGITNLLEGVAGPLPDRVAEYLKMLDMDCQRMARTVEDILDFSRLESKTMQLHRAKLLFDRLIQRGAVALCAQAQVKHIELALSPCRELGFVECDAFKTVRAIINIIGNAIKFTPEGGRVEIELHRDDNSLVAEITDNGIGIAPQHLARVTEKYFRAGEHISGTGLGLSIAKEIAELHGGRLAVQSPPPGRERGTRVSFSLPAVPPPSILIAHNDGVARKLLEQQLRAWGYHVSACANHDVVLNLARQTRPDVGILDVPNSGMHESHLVFRMKADPDLTGIPLVGVARGSLDPAMRGILNGLEIPVLSTPWREEDLLDSIEAAIKGVSSSTVLKT